MVVGSRSGLARAVELLLREENGLEVDPPEPGGHRGHHGPPDLIVVDGGSHRPEAAEQLRVLRTEFPRVPLLLMTADPLAWADSPVEDLHVVRVPFDPEAFLTEVRRLARHDG